MPFGKHLRYRGCVAVALLVPLLSGCANKSIADALGAADTSKPRPADLGNAELHTFELAEELFGNLQFLSERRQSPAQTRIAVAGFVPVTTMTFDGNNQHPLMLLGHQLEQGMMTEANRRGFLAQDFKTTNDIIISDDADRVFSRQLAHLSSQRQNVDFFLSGTIVEQQEGAMVNARLIDVRSKDVLAAATKFFPAGLFWQREKVTTRHGLLYRTGT